jgi:hypothetical protein
MHTSAPASTAAKVRPSHQLVIDVLLARQRHGHTDTTDAEIQDLLERKHAPRRFERGWISARINEMKSCGLVEQSRATRVDAQALLVARTTGREPSAVRAVFLPMQQARLVA